MLLHVGLTSIAMYRLLVIVVSLPDDGPLRMEIELDFRLKHFFLEPHILLSVAYRGLFLITRNNHTKESAIMTLCCSMPG